MALSVCPLVRLTAQCPDGAPPPCRGAAPARRPAPPLDARTWIVLPFENVARNAEIDWLREASVNLLYLDLSRWRDIRVVDDERVADLMREVPETRAGALSLQTGMAVARRAGAGKLVMGDLLKVGNRTRVVAKVYDVRSGQRLRTVQQETAIADSIMPIFGRLARGILDVAPPEGAQVGIIGTTSIEAYRAYVAGVSALNRVNLGAAHAAFDTALALDSTFALAHYKLAVVIGWENPNDTRRRTHAEAGNRFGTSLPPRERSLIQGLVHQALGRWGDACDVYHALLRSDSTDVEAWYNLGECSYHDQRVNVAAGDSSRGEFRSSWNTAMRAFRRALELDPTYHLAFAHVPDILLVEFRAGCAGLDVMTGCSQSRQYLGALRRSGDSLVATAVRATNQELIQQQRQEAQRTGAWRANLDQSLALAEAWVQTGPNEPRAHLAMARSLLRLGRAEDAARSWARMTGISVGSFETARMMFDRLELLLKIDSSAAAGRYADSLIGVRTIGPLPGVIAATMGRFHRFGEIFGQAFQGPPILRTFLLAWPELYAGVPPAGYLEVERGIDSLFSAQGGAGALGTRTVFLGSVVPWTLQLRRSPIPELDVNHADPKLRYAAVAVTGDTARMRAALALLDSQALTLPRELPDPSGLVMAAEGWLFLGDSARALARLLEFEQRWPFANPQQPMTGNFGNLPLNIFVWGRAWMRLGDLAAAANRPDVARRAYNRVVGMWTGADPSLQPMVTRAREALGRL